MTVLKTVVAGLVLVNVGYFLWTQGIGGGPPRGGAETSVGVGAGAGSGATLRLVSEGESPPAATRALAPTNAATSNGAATSGGAAMSGGAATSGSAVVSDRCVSLGPFKDITEAAHAAATLRGGGYDPRQRAAEGEVWAGVWVYLSIPPSKPAADQMRAKLKAGGIEDVLEMPGPNDTPVLSLGLYSEPKRAEGRVAQAQSLGLNPALADRKRTGNVYWIDIDLKPTDGAFNPGDLQSDAAHNVHLEVKACPSPNTAR